MASSQPLFSIVVPTFNRPQALAACLDAVCRQADIDGGYEIIVVDDGSSHDLAPVVNRFRGRVPLQLRRQVNSGAAQARNSGVSQAAGQYLAFTDDDCRPAEDWLLRLAAHLDRAPDALVGGQTINALEDNIYSTASQLLLHYVYQYYQIGRRDHAFFTSNNMAVDRSRFVALGGFDSRFSKSASEDRELCERWHHHHLPLHYAADAVVHHAHEMTLPAFWRQHFNYGRGAHRYHVVRAQYRRDHVKIEPWSFYRDLLRYPFREQTRASSAALSCLLMLAQASYALGFLVEKASSAPRPS